MKIGVFDSGLGGLAMLKAIIEELAEYDYLYLGDTKRIPYGNRSEAVIYRFTKQAVEYLFRNDCGLVLIACNTASACALRKIQREYVAIFYPSRRVLGVIIPTVEVAAQRKNIKRLGVLGTRATVRSRSFKKEFKKVNVRVAVFEKAAPDVVALIERGDAQRAAQVLCGAARALLRKGADGIILGCTHYALLKEAVRRAVGDHIIVFAQDEIIPGKLREYLERHPEIETKLAKNGRTSLRVTEVTPALRASARDWLQNTGGLVLTEF